MSTAMLETVRHLPICCHRCPSPSYQVPQRELHQSQQEEGCCQHHHNHQRQLHWASPKKCGQWRALHSTNAESLGRTARSNQEGRQVLQGAVRREEVAAHRGCSYPGELRIHKIAGCPAGHIGFEEDRAVDQEVLHTETVVQAGHRMEIAVQEGHHMEMARVVHHKETARGVHHREKELGARHKATEQAAVHRKAIAQEAVALGGKEGHRSGLKGEGQKV